MSRRRTPHRVARRSPCSRLEQALVRRGDMGEWNVSNSNDILMICVRCLDTSIRDLFFLKKKRGLLQYNRMRRLTAVDFRRISAYHPALTVACLSRHWEIRNFQWLLPAAHASILKGKSQELRQAVPDRHPFWLLPGGWIRCWR